jgi:phosphocarrier protein HPr
MVEKKLSILNEEGMHARPAGAFVKTANEFKSAVEIRSNGISKNGKSLMGIMSLGLAKDSEITIVVTGEDEANALDKLTALVQNKFQL